MRCIATAQGYDNVKVREPGEEFEMPDGTKPGTWFTVVKAKSQRTVAAGDANANQANADQTNASNVA